MDCGPPKQTFGWTMAHSDGPPGPRCLWARVVSGGHLCLQLQRHTKQALTSSAPTVPNCCCSNGSAPYWSNPPFLIFDIRALWRSALSARAPECQKLKMVG